MGAASAIPLNSLLRLPARQSNKPQQTSPNLTHSPHSLAIRLATRTSSTTLAGIIPIHSPEPTRLDSGPASLRWINPPRRVPLDPACLCHSLLLKGGRTSPLVINSVPPSSENPTIPCSSVDSVIAFYNRPTSPAPAISHNSHLHLSIRRLNRHPHTHRLRNLPRPLNLRVIYRAQVTLEVTWASPGYRTPMGMWRHVFCRRSRELDCSVLQNA